MQIFKIKIEEQPLLIKYYLMKHLILLKIKNTIDVNVDLLQWLTFFFDKKTSGGAIKKEIMENEELAK